MISDKETTPAPGFTEPCDSVRCALLKEVHKARALRARSLEVTPAPELDPDFETFFRECEIDTLERHGLLLKSMCASLHEKHLRQQEELQMLRERNRLRQEELERQKAHIIRLRKIKALLIKASKSHNEDHVFEEFLKTLSPEEIDLYKRDLQEIAEDVRKHEQGS
ncbi:MAG: hypothetical protein SPL30_09145 [Succinivibrio sp.]|jgi:hypothetical protein|nr:hypothetical protein [Succinivibrio sp.]